MSESEADKPEIIVDSDWKAKVEKEKEVAPPEPAAKVAKQHVGSDSNLPPAPPATFDVLVSMLFTQAMAMLGHLPDPGTGDTKVNKPYAKHYIDTLEMLGEKTKGNLNEDETKILSEALHALRMMYVNTKATG
jgi:Domain of unknown function (DUF1844)